MVQVDRMQPTLKASETKRLRPKYYDLLIILLQSSFRLNLRRYNLARALRLDPDSVPVKADVRNVRLKLVGRTRPPAPPRHQPGHLLRALVKPRIDMLSYP